MKALAEVLAEHVPCAAIGMFNFPNGGGNSRNCLCGERIEVMFAELSDDESSTDAKLNAKIAAHQAAALTAAGFGLVADARTIYEQARDCLQALIDHPDKAVSVAEYRAQITAAQKASNDAHDAWMGEK